MSKGRFDLFAVSRSEPEDLEEPEKVRARALLLLYLEQHVTVGALRRAYHRHNTGHELQRDLREGGGQ